MRAAFFIAALVTASCSGPKPVDPSWLERAGTRVLGLRWVKVLTPGLPNFLVPEMLEEHDRFNPIETSSAGFDTDSRRVFIGASVGGLYCLDLRGGETVWRFDLSHPVGSKPLYDPKRKYVFFGADDGRMYALHALSGRLVWKTATGGEIRRGAAMYEETLYVGNADGTVLALNPENGEIIWQYRHPEMEGFTAFGYANIALYPPYLLVGFSDGTISAMDPVAGTNIWFQDLAADVSPTLREGTVNFLDADATPVVSGQVVVAASIEGGTYGLDLGSGKVVWTRPDLKDITGLASDDYLVYAAHSGVGLSALDPRDGGTVWTRRFSAGTLQDPLLHNDTLLVTDSEFGLYVVSAGTGELLQRVDQKEGFFARPSAHAGYLVVLGNRGTLYAMSIQ